MSSASADRRPLRRGDCRRWKKRSSTAGWGRPLVYTLGILFLVTSCGTGSSGEGPDGETSPYGGWEALYRVDAGGTLSLEAALEAFVVAIGPLPGVAAEDPGDLPDGGSGTPAVRGVLDHWDELTEEQRSTIDGYLTGSTAGVRSGAVLAMATPSAPSTEPDEQAILGLIEQIEGRIADDLGRELGVPIELRLSPQETKGTSAAYVAMTDAGGGYFGQMAKCTIVIIEPGIEAVSEIDDGVPSDKAVFLIAHEIFHCFQGALTTSLAENHSRPLWVIEGMAEWAAASYSGTSGAGSWQAWLEVPTSDLFERSYSAIGFWSHLDEHGADVWLAADIVTLASNGGSVPAYDAAISAAGPDALAAWSAGYYRDPSHAPMWDQDGPAILPFKYPAMTSRPSLESGQEWSVDVEPRMANTWDTDLEAQVVVVGSTGHGMMLLTDGSELTFPGQEVLCTDPGGCLCPEGSASAAPIARIVTGGPARIALTGHTAGARLDASGWTLDDYCDQVHSVPECIIGTWTSTEYTALGETVQSGTGTGIALTIDEAGHGYFDLSGYHPVIASYNDPTAPWVRILQSGSGWFTAVGSGPADAEVIGGSSYAYSVVVQVDLGNGWIDGGPGISGTGFLIGPGASLSCWQGGLVFWLPSGFSWYDFERTSEAPDEIPPIPDDAVDFGGDGGDGESSGGSPEPPPPGWGAGYDACTIADPDALEEIVGEDIEIPETEDDVSTPTLRQCTIPGVATIQIAPPSSPDFYASSAEALDSKATALEGVQDWGLAALDGSVVFVAGGNASATVVFFPWTEIVEGSEEYASLVDLLSDALGRLTS